jgi:hypothetical protein
MTRRPHTTPKKEQHFGDHRVGSGLEEESQQNQARRHGQNTCAAGVAIPGQPVDSAEIIRPVVGECVVGTLRAEGAMAFYRMWAQGSVCPGNPGG